MPTEDIFRDAGYSEDQVQQSLTVFNQLKQIFPNHGENVIVDVMFTLNSGGAAQHLPTSDILNHCIERLMGIVDRPGNEDYRKSSTMTPEQGDVFMQLKDIFPTYENRILEISVTHPSNNTLGLGNLLEKCIDDLFEGRTASMAYAAATVQNLHATKDTASDRKFVPENDFQVKDATEIPCKSTSTCTLPHRTIDGKEVDPNKEGVAGIETAPGASGLQEIEIDDNVNTIKASETSTPSNADRSNGQDNSPVMCLGSVADDDNDVAFVGAEEPKDVLIIGTEKSKSVSLVEDDSGIDIAEIVDVGASTGLPSRSNEKSVYVKVKNFPAKYSDECYDIFKCKFHLEMFQQQKEDPVTGNSVYDLLLLYEDRRVAENTIDTYNGLVFRGKTKLEMTIVPNKSKQNGQINKDNGKDLYEPLSCPATDKNHNNSTLLSDLSVASAITKLLSQPYPLKSGLTEATGNLHLAGKERWRIADTAGNRNTKPTATLSLADLESMASEEANPATDTGNLMDIGPSASTPSLSGHGVQSDSNGKKTASASLMDIGPVTSTHSLSGQSVNSDSNQKKTGAKNASYPSTITLSYTGATGTKQTPGAVSGGTSNAKKSDLAGKLEVETIGYGASDITPEASGSKQKPPVNRTLSEAFGSSSSMVNMPSTSGLNDVKKESTVVKTVTESSLSKYSFRETDFSDSDSEESQNKVLADKVEIGNDDDDELPAINFRRRWTSSSIHSASKDSALLDDSNDVLKSAEPEAIEIKDDDEKEYQIEPIIPLVPDFGPNEIDFTLNDEDDDIFLDLDIDNDSKGAQPNRTQANTTSGAKSPMKSQVTIHSIHKITFDPPAFSQPNSSSPSKQTSSTTRFPTLGGFNLSSPNITVNMSTALLPRAENAKRKSPEPMEVDDNPHAVNWRDGNKSKSPRKDKGKRLLRTCNGCGIHLDVAIFRDHQIRCKAYHTWKTYRSENEKGSSANTPDWNELGAKPKFREFPPHKSKAAENALPRPQPPSGVPAPPNTTKHRPLLAPAVLPPPVIFQLPRPPVFIPPAPVPIVPKLLPPEPILVEAAAQIEPLVDLTTPERPKQNAAGPAKPVDPLQAIKDSVVALFPDVAEEHVEMLVNEYPGQLWEADGATPNPHLIHVICDQLIEKAYPKKQETASSTETTLSASATTAELVTSPDSEIDYYNTLDMQIPSSDLQKYIYQAVDQLSYDFKMISKNDISEVFKVCSSNYACAHRQLLQIWNLAMEKAQVENGASAGLSKLRGFMFKAEFEAGSQKHTITVRLLKNGRKTSPRSLKSPIIHLKKQMEYVKLKAKETASETDHKMALQINEEEYEELGQCIECGCCYGEYPFEQMVQCYEGHLFCENCLRQYAQESVFGHGKAGLSCMTDGCEASFPKSQLEKALPSNVLATYEDRVREENLNLADLGDLIKCPHCDFRAMMDPLDKVFRCQDDRCRKETCRYCQVDWTEHFGKRCTEVEKKDETKLRTQYEEKMTQAKVRMCHRCKAQFMKEDGCNKMTCRCGAKMCYICRKPNIDYDHFCRHPRDPGHQCKTCTACSLWTNPDEDDDRAVKEIQKAAEQERKDKGFEGEKVFGVPDSEPPRKKAKR